MWKRIFALFLSICLMLPVVSMPVGAQIRIPFTKCNGCGSNFCIDPSCTSTTKIMEEGITQATDQMDKLFLQGSGLMTQTSGILSICATGLSDFISLVLGIGKWLMIGLGIALILALFFSLSIRSYQKAKNSPAALQRLQLLHEHQLKMQEAKSAEIAKIEKF